MFLDIWSLVPFLVGVYKVGYFCFSGSVFQKTTQQQNCCSFEARILPNFVKIFHKTAFSTVQKPTKITLLLENAALPTTITSIASYLIAALTFYENRNWRVAKEIGFFFFTNGHVEYLYTLFKNRFSDKIAVKRGQMCNIMYNTVYF